MLHCIRKLFKKVMSAILKILLSIAFYQQIFPEICEYFYKGVFVVGPRSCPCEYSISKLNEFSNPRGERGSIAEFCHEKVSLIRRIQAPKMVPKASIKKTLKILKRFCCINVPKLIFSAILGVLPDVCNSMFKNFEIHLPKCRGPPHISL